MKSEDINISAENVGIKSKEGDIVNFGFWAEPQYNKKTFHLPVKQSIYKDVIQSKC